MTPDELRDGVAAQLRLAGVQRGERLVVAVSGGRDSMVLLHALDALGEGAFPLELHVAHLNHQLRPEADSDAAFVSSIAAERGLPYTCGTEDITALASARRLSLELAARSARLRFLESVRKSTESARIVLGHHANDQAETMLMRVLRGCGTTGLRGMRGRRDHLVRPLLPFTRDQLQLYAQNERVTHREDQSNSDVRFTRNRIRHELIPALERDYNPALVRTLSRSARLLSDEDDALHEMAQAALETISYVRLPDRVILAVPLLLRYHIAIQRRVLREILHAVAPPDSSMESADVAALLDMAYASSAPLRRLKHGVWAQGTNDQLIIRTSPLTPARECLLRVPGTTELSSTDMAVETRVVDVEQFARMKSKLGEWTAALDSSVAASPLLLRSVRAGDRIQPLGMRGHKKLSDLLVDAKWPRILRDDALVLERRRPGLEAGSEIVWALGLRVCDRYRVTEATEKVVFMELKGAAVHALPGKR
jgi:tRNA(Ile)-lysidine synthase